MDTIDQAQRFAEMDLERSLKAQRLAAQSISRPVAQGYCLNQECMASFGEDRTRLFCNSECADRHHRLHQYR